MFNAGLSNIDNFEGVFVLDLGGVEIPDAIAKEGVDEKVDSLSDDFSISLRRNYFSFKSFVFILDITIPYLV